MDMNKTIVGNSFRGDQRGENDFEVDLDATVGQGPDKEIGEVFSSDVVEGNFEAVPAKRRPFLKYVAYSLLGGVVFAAAAGYYVSSHRIPSASDIDFNSIKQGTAYPVAGPNASAAAADQAAGPFIAAVQPPITGGPTVSQVVPPVIASAPAVAAVNPSNTVLPANSAPTTPTVAGVAPLPIPAMKEPVRTTVPAPNTSAAPPLVTSQPPPAATIKQTTAPISTVANTASPPQVTAVKAPAISPTQPSKTTVASNASAAQPQAVKPVAANPVIAPKPAIANHVRTVQPVKVVNHPSNSIPDAKRANLQAAIKPVAPSVSSNPAQSVSTPAVLNNDVLPLVVVVPDQIGIRSVTADFITITTSTGLQRFKVGDYLPSGERLAHIDASASTIVTDKKIIRILN